MRNFVLSLLTLGFLTIPAWSQTVLNVTPSFIELNSNAPVTVTGFGFASPQPIYLNCVARNVPSANGGTTLTLDLSNEPPGDVKITVGGSCSAADAGPIITVEVRPLAPIAQTLVGLDVSGASSTSPQAVFLGLAAIDIRARKTTESVRDSKGFWFGGSLKIAGMAQPGNLSNLSFSDLSGYFAQAANATPDKIVQSFEGIVSAAYEFSQFEYAQGTFDSGAKPHYTRTLFTLSAVMNAGALTPLSAAQANPPVYYATTQIQQAYPHAGFASTCAYAQGATPPCFVAFIPADRTRFYRHYEAGVRIKMYAEDHADGQLRFPGIADVTLGQNEYVTGGKFQGVVLHLGGTLPIPYLDGAYAFGSMDLGLNNSVSGGTQLLLVPAAASANLTFQSPSVYTVTVSQPNRDRYMFGFGIDLYHFIQKASSKK